LRRWGLRIFLLIQTPDIKNKMTNMNYILKVGLVALALGLTACATSGGGASNSTASVAIEAALPLVRTGAAVATGDVLNFAVTQSSARTRLANEMYSAASAVYSLSDGTFPTPEQFQASIVAFGGSQADAAYAQFSVAIAGLYAAYYSKLVTGDAKTAADLLNAIAGGIEDATRAYVTTPTVSTSVADVVSF